MLKTLINGMTKKKNHIVQMIYNRISESDTGAEQYPGDLMQEVRYK